MNINVPSVVRVKPNAINKIGKYLRSNGFDSIAIFWGENLRELIWPKVQISLDSSEIKVVFDQTISNNEAEQSFATSLKIQGQAKAIVAIGGGKAIDFAKYLSFINHLPFFSIPTTISNDGFASPMASLTVEGKRRSFKTNLPFGVIIDTDIILQSPVAMIYSGIGDLFCKYTAIYDWKLAFHKTNEYVDDFAVTISRNATDVVLYFPDKNIKNQEFLRAIANSLLISGIAMEVAQSSRPASGSEHLISHAMDRLSDKPYLHGLQVGMATYLVSYLQNETHEIVKLALQSSGFFEFLSANKFQRKLVEDAVKMAPSIKENFYTILSEKGNVEKLIQFIREDEICDRFLE